MAGSLILPGLAERLRVSEARNDQHTEITFFDVIREDGNSAGVWLYDEVFKQSVEGTVSWYVDMLHKFRGREWPPQDQTYVTIRTDFFQEVERQEADWAAGRVILFRKRFYRRHWALELGRNSVGTNKRNSLRQIVTTHASRVCVAIRESLT